MKTKHCRYCNKDVVVADFSPHPHTKDRSGEAVRLNRLSICRQIHAIADEFQAQ